MTATQSIEMNFQLWLTTHHDHDSKPTSDPVTTTRFPELSRSLTMSRALPCKAPCTCPEARDSFWSQGAISGTSLLVWMPVPTNLEAHAVPPLQTFSLHHTQGHASMPVFIIFIYLQEEMGRSGQKATALSSRWVLIYWKHSFKRGITGP